MIAGGVTFLFALAMFTSSDKGSAIGMLFFAVVTIGAGILWLRSLRPTFHVFLASASAERQSLTSKDEALVDRVTNAINDAITYRG